MKCSMTKINGVTVAETTPFTDTRGAFMRLFCAQELSAVAGTRQILQINHSRTTAKGAVRGMHFQHAPHAEMKMVRCLKGRVLDIAVDLRAESPTFLQYHAEELSAEHNRMMIIPEGCAHGFQTLEQDCELLYLHTAFYDKTAEGGVRHDDPAISIRWPLPVVDLSERDKNHPLLAKDFKGIRI